MIIIEITVVHPVSKLKKIWQINAQKQKDCIYYVWAYNYETDQKLECGLLRCPPACGLESLSGFRLNKFLETL